MLVDQKYARQGHLKGELKPGKSYEMREYGIVVTISKRKSDNPNFLFTCTDRSKTKWCWNSRGEMQHRDGIKQYSPFDLMREYNGTKF